MCLLRANKILLWREVSNNRNYDRPGKVISEVTGNIKRTIPMEYRNGTPIGISGGRGGMKKKGQFKIMNIDNVCKYCCYLKREKSFSWL